MPILLTMHCKMFDNFSGLQDCPNISSIEHIWFTFSYVMADMQPWHEGTSRYMAAYIRKLACLWCLRGKCCISRILFNLFCCHSCSRKAMCCSSRIMPINMMPYYSTCSEKSLIISLACRIAQICPPLNMYRSRWNNARLSYPTYNLCSISSIDTRCIECYLSSVYQSINQGQLQSGS